jgi:hypothetical protein
VSSTQRHADWRSAKNFLVKRLQTVFHEVHPKPAVLRNSKKRSDIFILLCSSESRWCKNRFKNSQSSA